MARVPPPVDSALHDEFMGIAIAEATAALDAREVPIGCVFVIPRTASNESSTSSASLSIDNDQQQSQSQQSYSSSSSYSLLARGHNRTNRDYNATRHAELVAIEQLVDDAVHSHATPAIALAALKQSTLFVTVEPCIMCAAMLVDLGVPYVVFGASNTKFGGCGSVLSVHDGQQRLDDHASASSSSSSSSQSLLHDPPASAAYGKLQCTSNVRGKEAIKLLQVFYSKTNIRAPANIVPSE